MNPPQHRALPAHQPARFVRDPAAERWPTPVEEPPLTRVQRLANHDDNEERHYLAQHDARLVLAYGLSWLTWTFGLGFAHDPWPSGERWAAWLHLGPLTIEIFTPPRKP